MKIKRQHFPPLSLSHACENMCVMFDRKSEGYPLAIQQTKQHVKFLALKDTSFNCKEMTRHMEARLGFLFEGFMYIDLPI
jgi:hypothetical protein